MELLQEFDSNLTDTVIKKGINYLMSKNVNGCWRGFPTLAGESTVWVTGFVLAHIRNLCDETQLISEAENFLLQSRHKDGGWSYSIHVPADADSTAWCMQALQYSKDFTAAEKAKANTFLWSHFTGKGISTYKTDSGIAEFIGVPSNDWIAGWTSAHADVSIAAVLADPTNEKNIEVLKWLSEQQTAKGFINSYWWRCPCYATTLFLRALAGSKYQVPQAHATMVLQSLVQDQLTTGGFGLDSLSPMNPFETALALEAFTHLSFFGQQAERTLCGNTLLHAQQEDGSWAGDFILRIPAPKVTNPGEVSSWNNADGGGNSLIEDKGGVFATAMACYALDCWRKSETLNNHI